MVDVSLKKKTNGKRAVLIIVYRQPGANIIDTVIVTVPEAAPVANNDSASVGAGQSVNIDVLANGIGEGVTELLRGNGHRTTETAPRRSRAKPAKARPKPAGSRTKPTNARQEPTSSRTKQTATPAKASTSRAKPSASRAKSTKAATRRRG